MKDTQNFKNSAPPAQVIKPVDKLKKILNTGSVLEQFKNALGSNRDVFIASLIDTFNDALTDCDPTLVVKEALKAAVLKLPISKGLGFAFILTYNKNYKENGVWQKQKIPRFQIGYKGLIQLAMRSGQLKILNPGIVYEGEFKGSNKLTGIIDLTGERISDKVIGYFTYMELMNGFQKTEYWPIEKIMAHAEKYSPAYQADLLNKTKKSLWITNLNSMGIKTLLIATLSKYAPLSIEFLTVLHYENEHFDEYYQDELDITPPESMQSINFEKRSEVKIDKEAPIEEAPPIEEMPFNGAVMSGHPSFDKEQSSIPPIEELPFSDFKENRSPLPEHVAKLEEMYRSGEYFDVFQKAYEMKTFKEENIRWVIDTKNDSGAKNIIALILSTKEILESGNIEQVTY